MLTKKQQIAIETKATHETKTNEKKQRKNKQPTLIVINSGMGFCCSFWSYPVKDTNKFWLASHADRLSTTCNPWCPVLHTRWAMPLCAAKDVQVSIKNRCINKMHSLLFLVVLLLLLQQFFARYFCIWSEMTSCIFTNVQICFVQQLLLFRSFFFETHLQFIHGLCVWTHDQFVME